MSDEKQGSVFAFGGVTGALVAVVALLVTLAALTTMGLLTQRDTANDYYTIKNVTELQTINKGKQSSDFIVSVPAPE